MIKFRTYQLDLINKIIQSIKEGHRKPLVVLPTGGGKTVVMGGLLNYLQQEFGFMSNLVTEPSVMLKRQVGDQLRSMNAIFSIETYHTAMNRGHRAFDSLIFDEAHHIMSPYWQHMPELIQCEFMCGFTATPYRADECPLLQKNGGLFDDLIIGATASQLTAEGFLADLDYYAYPPIQVVDKSPIILLDQEVGFMEHTYHVIPNKEADIIPEYVENFNGMDGIIFCRSVKHAIQMTAEFNAVGINSDYVSCYRPKVEINKTLKDFKDGKIAILAACNMASEGMDLPRAKLGIMAREIVTSLTLYLQQIGRLLRPFNDQRAAILDSVGNMYRFPTIDKIHKKPII